MHTFPPLPVHARLVALTDDARGITAAGEILIRHFPFRVGLERRGPSPMPWQGVERRNGSNSPSNDLYLGAYATYQRREISHEHFQIEADGAGLYELVDRGSRRGALVNGRRLGGACRGGRAPLSDGDVITVGTPASPFVFRFQIEG